MAYGICAAVTTQPDCCAGPDHHRLVALSLPFDVEGVPQRNPTL